MSERVNSMCAIYADLIEGELRSGDPDLETVYELLGYIKRYCQVVGFEPGETPEHLEAFLIEEGSHETGTVEIDGKEIPRSAAALMDDE